MPLWSCCTALCESSVLSLSEAQSWPLFFSSQQPKCVYLRYFCTSTQCGSGLQNSERRHTKPARLREPPEPVEREAYRVDRSETTLIKSLYLPLFTFGADLPLPGRLSLPSARALNRGVSGFLGTPVYPLRRPWPIAARRVVRTYLLTLLVFDSQRNWLAQIQDS